MVAVACMKAVLVRLGRPTDRRPGLKANVKARNYRSDHNALNIIAQVQAMLFNLTVYAVVGGKGRLWFCPSGLSRGLAACGCFHYATTEEEQPLRYQFTVAEAPIVLCFMFMPVQNADANLLYSVTVRTATDMTDNIPPPSFGIAHKNNSWIDNKRRRWRRCGASAGRHFSHCTAGMPRAGHSVMWDVEVAPLSVSGSFNICHPSTFPRRYAATVAPVRLHPDSRSEAYAAGEFHMHSVFPLSLQAPRKARQGSGMELFGPHIWS